LNEAYLFLIRVIRRLLRGGYSCIYGSYEDVSSPF
jgi:hypothetical protein